MTTTSTDLIGDLFEVLVNAPDRHAPTSADYRVLRAALEPVIKSRFSAQSDAKQDFGPIGQIAMPYVEMGAITSLHLFGLDEMILLSFYNANRNRYKKTVDFGTNIGLHTIVMNKCGFSVRSFEPDPHHIEILNRNLALNDVTTDLHEAAISLEDGKTEFVRVKGNTTGSHISGAKSDPYGELDRFEVTIEAAQPHLDWADFAKIDIEGHEATLITGLSPDTWLTTDAMVEVGTQVNADIIFEYLADTPVNMYAQKTGWNRVSRPEHMPTSHRDGSLFLTKLDGVPWG